MKKYFLLHRGLFWDGNDFLASTPKGKFSTTLAPDGTRTPDPQGHPFDTKEAALAKATELSLDLNFVDVVGREPRSSGKTA